MNLETYLLNTKLNIILDANLITFKLYKNYAVCMSTLNVFCKMTVLGKIGDNAEGADQS